MTIQRFMPIASSAIMLSKQGDYVRYSDYLEHLNLSPAAADVLAERHRQIAVKGWTPEHDDEQNQYGDLAIAASCYARHAYSRGWVYNPESPEKYQDEEIPDDWPWDDTWWKPTDPRRDLVKATALLLAELERLDRQSQGSQK
ncbi:hypothetical protein PEE20_15960 [Salmonella enterica subsp. enterica serovar Bispebjerg]|uniref:hypothetical protein n=1 Tax=Salmonella enterica TaxID=28901 RepID=UPI0022E82171|nr:hypothetical protein [Salmonella enterica]WBQ81055.1 hypothetical protein PEE20_15960 [Salmonella enterica subsp. enterica serovar Bispebjerg]